MLDQPDRQNGIPAQKGEAFITMESTRFERGSVAPPRRRSRSNAIATSTVPVFQFVLPSAGTQQIQQDQYL